MPPSNLLDRLFAFETRVFLSSASIPTRKLTGMGAAISTPLCARIEERAKRRPMRTPECESFDRGAERIYEYL